MYIIPLFLFACGTDPEQPPKAPSVTTHDYDGDGYTEIDGDCNDEDATISPGGTEECDDIDNDCDGVIDNGVLTTYYADSDGDGFGDDTSAKESCTNPTEGNYIENAGDCDDTDADVNPEATEVCDDIDNDCDSAIDIADDSLEADSAREFYVDTDGDGYYGDTEGAEAVIACSSPDGYSDLSGDCDDANELINPDASEVCDDVDNNCDGEIDDADDDLLPESTTTFYQDVDGDTFGTSNYTEQACVQPQGYVTNSDDCDDTEENSYLGADELCDEEDNDCDGDIDEDATDGQMWYLDVDGDGFGVSEAEFSAEGVSPISSCTMPAGYSEFDTDCDDGDPAINPDKMWYPDADLDGNGSLFGGIQSCLQPGGYIDDSSDCNDIDPNLNALDVDGDLETTCDGDCDDNDIAINTSGQEVCDNADVDEDCDGLINGDDDSVDVNTYIDFYEDLDNDGYGNDNVVTSSCSLPEGYAELGGDCLDEDSTNGAATNPGADEICDGINNNCDTDDLIDENAVDGVTWYIDADSDGDGVPYADGETQVTACDNLPPADTETHSYALTSTDCDDANAALNANTVWYYDIDGDTYGSDNITEVQCTQPVGYELNGGDCDDSDVGVFPGNLANETDATGCYIDADNDGYGDNAPTDSNIDAGTDCDDADSQYSPVAAWYKDNDLDGFGDDAIVQFACDSVFSANNRIYVADPNTADFDCDDADNTVYPNAPEVCIDDGNGGLIADGIDQNCNGVDEGNEDSDGDGTTSCAGDCNDADASINYSTIDDVCGSDADSDGYVAIADGGTDCDDTTGTVNPGQVETFNDGVDNDCDGNDVLISSGEGGTAAFEPGDLVITEIMHTPIDNFGSKQFFEVYNTTNLPIKLNNLQLVNGDGGVYTIDKPTDVVVPAGSYYLFVASISGSQLTVAGDGSVELTDYNDPFELTPYRGSVTIQDPSSGVVIDSVSYGFELGFTAETGKYTQGSSIVVPYLITDADYALYSSNTPDDWNDSAASWCVSTSAIATNDGSSGFGTPGTANDACISSTDWDNLKESTDVPNDGVPELLGDCDDTDGSEGLPANAYYQDLDDDGYGVASTETLVCNSVKATCDAYDQTLKNTDDDYDEFCATYAYNNSNECDDTNDQVYIGAGYLETGTDADGNDLSTVCMQDGDGDGFGDLSPSSSSATVGTDCNDLYSGAYPSALTLELCNLYASDTTDYNCDNTEESGASRCSMDTTGTFSLSGTIGEYWSNGSAKSVGDIIGGDGIDDFVVAAHQVIGDSSNADYNAGKLYFYQGPLTSASTPHMTIQGASKNQLLGYQDINIGDVNGDGFNDIVMGAHGTHQVYVYPGKSGGFDAADIDFEVSIPASVSIITKDDAGVYTNLGWEAEIAGDVDGDGVNDLALVSRKVSGKKDGALHIYKGGLSVFPADVGITTHKLGDANELVTVTRGDATQKEFAESVIAMGDLNGDGFDDVAAIEEKTDGNYSDVYIFYGSANPTWDINSPDILIQNEPDVDGDGVDNYTNFKSTNIQNVGDIDSDGINDIAIVSATSVSYQELLGEKVEADYEGVGLVVIHNNLGDSSIPVRNTYSDAWISLFNPHPDQANYNFDTLTFPWTSGDVVYDSYSFGQSFTSGDVDGDGNIDFIVGGKNIDTDLSDSFNEEGGAYVYYGPLMGSYDSAHAFISGSGLKDNARLGSSVDIYSSGATNQIILVSPDVADNTDSTDVGTIYILDSSSIDTSQ